MTLILAIPARGGAVLASDGQITIGEVRSTGAKIRRLNSQCLWAAAGELAFIQRVEERLAALPPEEPLLTLRDKIGAFIKECVTDLLQMDFRTPFYASNPDSLLGLHGGDFVFIEASSRPRILHVMANGTPEWIDNRPFCTGSGGLFAYALLRKYEAKMKEMSLEVASMLAYKVIEEAIEVGAYGLGHPIDIWAVTEGEVVQLAGTRMAALADASRTLREAELQLLLNQSDSLDDKLSLACPF